jgi:hypothetical protein
MERWLNKNLHISYPVINLRKEALGNIKNRSQRERNVKNHKKDTKVRVDIVLKYPTL